MTSILASDLGRYVLDNCTLSSSDPTSPWLVAMASDCKCFHFCMPVPKVPHYTSVILQ